MKFTWGDLVRVSEDAESTMRPGDLADVVAITEINSEVLAKSYGAPLGETVYTVEFGDGSSAEVPERWLDKVWLPES